MEKIPESMSIASSPEKNWQFLYEKMMDDFIVASKIGFLRVDKSGNPEIEENVGKYAFQERKGNLASSELIDSPEHMVSFFETHGYKNIKPKSIINKGGTTLFTSAGVQIIEDSIFLERSGEEKKAFVAQPVFRTQFIDNVGEGTSTSFVNIATVIENPTLEEHFAAITDWMNLLEGLDLEKSRIIFKAEKREPQWGDKKFKAFVVKILYDGLELGDANYIYDMPQESRESLRISDIGFGLERIRWALRGGSYFNESELVDPCIYDYCKTMSILAGSGLKPSNKEQGYRFRQLSKKIVQQANEKKIDLIPILRNYYKYWKKWTHLDLPESGMVNVVNTENQRNLKNIE